MAEAVDARGVRKRHVQLLCRVERELLSFKTAGPTFIVPRDDAVTPGNSYGQTLARSCPYGAKEWSWANIPR